MTAKHVFTPQFSRLQLKPVTHTKNFSFWSILMENYWLIQDCSSSSSIVVTWLTDFWLDDERDWIMLVGAGLYWTMCTTSVQHLALVYTQHSTVKLVNNCNIQTFFLFCSAIILCVVLKYFTIAESHTRNTCFHYLPVYHELFNLLCHSWFNQ